MFDNTAILSKLKLLSFDSVKVTKYAMMAWFIGTFLNLLKQLLDLNSLLAAKQNEDPNKKDSSLDLKILNCYLGIISKIGDLFPSGQGSEIPHMLIGRPFAESTVGLGGLVAGVIAVYNAYRS